MYVQGKQELLHTAEALIEMCVLLIQLKTPIPVW